MNHNHLLTVRLSDHLVVACTNRGEAASIYNGIFVEEQYTPKSIQLRPGMTVLDIGAHIGLFALFAAPRVAPGTLYAFEPNPRMFELLNRNVSRYCSNVVTVPFGLGPKDGSAQFVIYAASPALSGIETYADRVADRDVLLRSATRDASKLGLQRLSQAHIEDLVGQLLHETVEELPVLSLKRVLDEFGIQRVDLLKLDIQGAEHEVLATLPITYWARVQQITGELHYRQDSQRFRAFFSLLADNGFNVATAQEDDLKGTNRYSFTAIR